MLVSCWCDVANMQEVISTVLKVRNGAKIECTNRAGIIDKGALQKNMSHQSSSS